VRDVPHTGEKVAQLRRKQVDDIEALGLCLEQSGRGRQEMNVRVGGYPTLRAEVLVARDLQNQLTLVRFDPKLSADVTGASSNPLISWLRRIEALRGAA
jgi:hypothetical protein